MYQCSQVLKCDVGQGLRFIILGSGWTTTSSGVRIDVSVTKAETGSVMLHGVCHHLVPFSTCVKLRTGAWALADLDAVSSDLSFSYSVLLPQPLFKIQYNTIIKDSVKFSSLQLLSRVQLFATP